MTVGLFGECAAVVDAAVDLIVAVSWESASFWVFDSGLLSRLST